MTAEQIAGKLTIPQAVLITDKVRSIGNPPVFVPCGDERWRAHGGTLRAMRGKGLLENTKFGLAFTPLGLEVRAILTKEPSHDQ